MLSLKFTTQKIQQCWNPIVTIKDIHIKEKIKKLFNTWQKLKKNRLRVSEVQRENENALLNSLDGIFECTLQTEKNNSTTKPVTSSKNHLSLNNLEPPVLLPQKSNAGCSVSSHEVYPSPLKKGNISEPRKQNIITPALSSMLDRTKTSHRRATFVVAATSVSLKQDL